jgi:tankyrase
MRVQVFDREQISVDILAEMGHEDLKQIGITAFGHRHKLLKGIEKLLSGNGTHYAKQTYLTQKYF